MGYFYFFPPNLCAIFILLYFYIDYKADIFIYTMVTKQYMI